MSAELRLMPQGRLHMGGTGYASEAKGRGILEVGGGRLKGPQVQRQGGPSFILSWKEQVSGLERLGRKFYIINANICSVQSGPRA